MQFFGRIFSRRRRYTDLSVSIHEHLQEQVEELMDGGMERGEAERTARRRFGNLALTEERSRQMWQFQTLESSLADLSFALRQLRKQRGMTAVILLTLALSVGAATAVFSVAYAVLVDPFPYKDVRTLVTPKLCAPEQAHCFWDTYTPAQFVQIEQNTTFFAGVTASTVGNVTITGEDEAQQIRGNYISPNTFDVLGVRPLLGRSPMRDDTAPGHEPVALLSNRYWLSHFGGSSSVLGRNVTVDGVTRTIIGVMPQRFLWRGADVYLPTWITPDLQIDGHPNFTLVGRLKSGVTEAQAAQQLQPIFNDFVHQDPHRFPQNLRVGLMSFDQMFQSGLTGTLELLIGAVFVLLLIGCANVSSLLLANAVKREHEFVVRSALGSSRVRLVRQVMIESILLGLLSVPFSLAFAYAGLQAMLRLVPSDTIPDEALVTLNVPVLLASLGIGLLAVIVAGMSPAWHSAAPRLSGILSGMRMTGDRIHRRFLNGFVVAEIALSLALMSLAGLMMRSMISVERVPILFPPDHTLMMRIPLTPKRYPKPEDKVRFFRQLLDRVSHVPGVSAVTVDAELPFLWGFGSQIQVNGKPLSRHDYSNVHMVDPAYASMAGVTLQQGHFIDEREISTASPDAVVTEDFAKRFFPEGNVLGQTFRLVDSGLFGKDDAAGHSVTIVGVTNSLPMYPGYQEKYPDLFLPYTAAPVMDAVVITTRLPAEALVQPVRRIVTEIDKDQPVTDFMPLRQLLNQYGYAGPRFALTLFGTFAAAALLLSLIGIYGVFSFATSRRTQEIGIRIALGAGRHEVIWMVLRQAGALALIGIGVGLPLAFVAARLAKSELFQTSQYDPLTFLFVVCALLLLAVAGTWLPARRAANVDPMEALRSK